MNDKRTRIIEAAKARIRHYGLRKTTMQEIADDAGIAVGTLYLYFKNKDDLVVACAGDFIARHHREAKEIRESSASADEKLRAYMTARFRASEETRTGSRHAVELTRAVLRVMPDRARDEGMIMFGYLKEILQAGVDEGTFEIADIERDAEIFLYSVAYFFPNALSDPAHWPTEETFLKVVDWFLDTWKTPKTASLASAPKQTR